MLVYRDDGEPIEPARAWAELRGRAMALTSSASHDAVTALLIDIGEVESATADALFPQRDACDPLAAAMRHASLEAGRLFIASRDQEPAGPRIAALRSALGRVPGDRLPPRAMRRVSEGYAYYALHPETYAAAARRFARQVRPRSAICIGIRSIGTSLSAVVAASLEREGVPATVWSVRPRGHPFDRRLSLGSDLEQALASAGPGAHYLVIDEGPGLSGSSFAAAARALPHVPAAALSFFPGWNADGSSFVSETACATWQRHRRWTASAEEAGVGIDGAADGSRGVDLSAGAWRAVLPGGAQEWPAVHPQHERVKRWLPERGEILRFAGLGRYGEARKARARALADSGLGPPPGALRSGYLALPFVEGTRCGPADAGDAMLAAIARHAAFVQRAFPAPRTPEFDELCRMIETNVSERNAGVTLPPLEPFRGAIGDAPAAAIDGRMLAHEWLRTAEGFVKIDALDHAADHFFPGAQDAAWDLAGAEAELDLSPAAARRMVSAYAAECADRTVGRRLEFFRIAYAAFQIGYAALAVQSLAGSEDARRFECRRERFVRRLRALSAR
jgi:hypothetical protein